MANFLSGLKPFDFKKNDSDITFTNEFKQFILRTVVSIETSFNKSNIAVICLKIKQFYCNSVKQKTILFM